MEGGVLVAGGDRDPNLPALAAALARRGAPHRLLLVGADHHPALSWVLAEGDPGDDRLEVDGETLAPAAVFLRHDVFTHLADRRPASAHRAQAWYSALSGWLEAHPEVRCLNRRRGLRSPPPKPYQLALARRVGLPVPATLVGNVVERIASFRPGGAVVKPVAGGAHCRPLDEVLAETPARDGVAPAPAIVQAALVPPERRVFVIGDRLLGFDVASTALDYRSDPSTRVAPWPDLPAPLAAGLRRLARALDLEFAAADFKTCPETGRLRFLEINTGPMFAAFDRAADGAVADAIAELIVERRPGARGPRRR
ncbi:MAG TPA: hypothetical protein VF100_05315 [Thermoanaerobaculia bacterium]